VSIKKALTADFLTERQKEFLRRRLEGQTLEQIGNEFGISRERVRQIGEVIKKKLHKNLSSRESKLYINEFNKLKKTANTGSNSYYRASR